MSRPACFLLLVLFAAGAAGIHYVGPVSGMALGADIIDANVSRGILLERYLWQQGLYPVVGIRIEGHYFDWADAASRSLWYIPAFLPPDGGLRLFGERLDARDI